MSSPKERSPVTLSEFLIVAEEQGAHKEYIKRAPQYLNTDCVKDVISHTSQSGEISLEQAASSQLSTYLDINPNNMPPLDLSSLSIDG
ncbi:MAG: hypothetical protein ACRBDI_04125 [Alphaproteobacteria bacterium]